MIDEKKSTKNTKQKGPKFLFFKRPKKSAVSKKKTHEKITLRDRKLKKNFGYLVIDILFSFTHIKCGWKLVACDCIVQCDADERRYDIECEKLKCCHE